MTRTKLASRVADDAKVSKKVAREVIDCFVDVLIEAIHNGERFVIHGLGTFGVKTRAPRTGRNPSTGEPIKIGAKRVVFFKASPTLKKSL